MQDVLAFVNDAGTLRFEGDATIPVARSVEGPVALVGGILTVEGRIVGDLVVLNGDLVLGPDAVLQGDVLLVGGQVVGDEAAITGMLTVYTRRLPLSQEDGVFAVREERRLERPGIFIGDSRLSIRAGTGYNRVEGLPILLGPVFRTGGSTPLRFDALATFRTESGLSLDDMGYFIRLEQAFESGIRWRLGATAYSEVQAVESRGISDLENSLASALFHRDLRDYFQNEGWSVYLDLEGNETPISARLAYRSEDHFPVAEGDPWTLFRSDDIWRPVALAAQGDFSYLDGEVEVDQRNNPDDPTDGWYLRARVIQGLSGSLAVPSHLFDPVVGPPTEPFSVSTTNAVGYLDLRRHARVDPDSDLRFRIQVAGSLERDPLPPQFQQSLGGVGSLPGYRRFTLDCGARSQPVYVSEDGSSRTTYPFYGCDRTALFQAEYRQVFSFDLDLGADDASWDDWRWWPDVDLSVAWLVFFDAGQGWSYTPGGSDTDAVADVGLGFHLGELGVYWAYPLSGDDRKGNFFVRLQHRF